MRTLRLLLAVLVLALGAVPFAGGFTAASEPRVMGTDPPLATEYYFHGVPQDQANKEAAFANLAPPPADSLTFSPSNILDAQPVTQQNFNPNPDSVPNPLAAWWTGPFTGGGISGTIRIDWYWQTTNAAGIAVGVEMNIKVVADPDFANPGIGTQTIIGQANTTFNFDDTLPTLFSTLVPVNGSIGGELLIQAASVFVDTGPGLTALYDNADYPSKWSLPPRPADLDVVKTESHDPADTGTELTYTVTVTNLGTAEATGAVLTDQLPAGTVLLATTTSHGTCSGTTTVSCNLGNLGGAVVATVTLEVGMTTSGSKTNQASVAATGDSDPSNNADSVTTTVTGPNCTAGLIGTAGNDNLDGTGSNEVLCGFRGDDILTGRGGNDFLIAGTGDDTLFGLICRAPAGGVHTAPAGCRGPAGTVADEVDRLAPGTGTDYVDGGGGLGPARVGDTVTYFDIRGALGVTVNLALTGAQDTGPGGSDTILNVESITGTRQDDTLRGNAGTNYLTGGRGNDQLFGEAGNDVLVGSQGTDALDGGADIDTASYKASPAGSVVDLTNGVASNDGVGSNDTLIRIEAISGSNAEGDMITGSATRDFLYGQGGPDTLNGEGGDDYLHGGPGSDVINGGSGNNTCVQGETETDCGAPNRRTRPIFPWMYGDARSFLRALNQVLDR